MPRACPRPTMTKSAGFLNGNTMDSFRHVLMENTHDATDSILSSERTERNFAAGDGFNVVRASHVQNR